MRHKRRRKRRVTSRPKKKTGSGFRRRRRRPIRHRGKGLGTWLGRALHKISVL